MQAIVSVVARALEVAVVVHLLSAWYASVKEQPERGDSEIYGTGRKEA